MLRSELAQDDVEIGAPTLEDGAILHAPSDGEDTPVPPAAAIAVHPPSGRSEPSSHSKDGRAGFPSRSGAGPGNCAQRGSSPPDSPGPAELGRHSEHGH